MGLSKLVTRVAKKLPSRVAWYSAFCKLNSKTCVKRRLLKRLNIGFQDQGEHSAILSTFIKLQFVIKIFVLSVFEWPFYTGLLYFL